MAKSDTGSGASPLPAVAGQTTAPRSRRLLKQTAAFLLLSTVLVSSVVHQGWLPLPSGIRHCFHRPQSIEDRVTKILTNTPLIDGHNDLAILLRALYKNKIYDPSFTQPWEQGGLQGHVDIPRLRAGLNGGAFWSVFWPCPANGTDYSDGAYASSVRATYEQIDLVNRLKAAYPSVFAPADVDSAAAALAAFRERGQLVSPLGVEGLHQIGNSAAHLRAYRRLGVRYATLTHNCGNAYADAALWESPLRKAPPVWGGLSPAGRALVAEMNRIGLIVDLSHTSVDTMLDVLGAKAGWQGSAAPVIFSHSSAHAVCPHPRNVPDRVLRLVKERNSLVMVNFAPDFVSCVDSGRADGLPDFYPANSTLAHVVDHIVHIGELIGYGHVGLGSDFDGIPATPRGLEDVSKYPDLVAELLARGVSDEDAAKVVGGNLLRVWAEVDRVAAELQKAGAPVLEDELPGFDVADEDLPGRADSAL